MTTPTPTYDRAALEKEGWLVIETEEEKQAAAPNRWGDEFWSPSQQEWIKDQHPYGFWPKEIYRRRIAQPAPVAATPWVSTKDRMPTEADADENGRVWHCIPDGRPYTCHYGRIVRETGGHWMRREKQPIPPLPVERKPTPSKLLVALRSIVSDHELMAEASSEARMIVANAADQLEARNKKESP